MNSKSLSIAEERRLLRAWRKGDEDAGNRLVKAFESWAITVAVSYNRGRRDDELVAAAMEGLAETMRKFDLKRKANGKHVRFSSLARIVVPQMIQRQILQRSRAMDHLALCGSHMPENITDTVFEEPACNDNRECVERLMALVIRSPDLNDTTKNILKQFIQRPSATLKEIGNVVGMTKEGVRLNLLKIRQAVLNDPELAEASLEAGLNLARG